MGGGVGCRSGHNTQEAAEELRDLAGDATYRQLLERHPDVTNRVQKAGAIISGIGCCYAGLATGVNRTR